MQLFRRAGWVIFLGVGLLFAVCLGAAADRLFGIRFLDILVKRHETFGVAAPALPAIGGRADSRIADVAEAVSESVVTVSLSKSQTQVKGFYLDSFGQFAVPESGSTQTVKQDIGTGFVVDKSGLIVTNNHVVADVTGSYKVITKDNKEYEVQKIYRDALNDLAILKVNANLTPASLGDSEVLRVGQSVIAIGTALGKYRHTVTVGVISGLGRGVLASGGGGITERLDNVIQTDAAINPGNSGGPLLDTNGNVIGVNVATSAMGQNIGFAIPINTLKESLDTFNRTGQFTRPAFGVRYQLLPKEVAILNEVPQGAYIRQVLPGSPAEKVGLAAGDVVLKIDGKEVLDESSSIARLILQKKVGDELNVVYWRQNETKTVIVKLEEAKE